MTDVSTLMGEVNRGVAELKSEMRSIKGAFDCLENEKLNKLSDDITLRLEQAQKEFRDQKTKDDTWRDMIESAIARGDIAKGDSGEELAQKKRKEVLDFFTGRQTFERNGQQKLELVRSETKTLSTDSAPDGGFIVYPELLDKMVTRMFDTSPMRRIADVRPTMRKYVDLVVDDDEPEFIWVGEGANQPTTDTPRLGLKRIDAFKIAAQPIVTIEMLEDSEINIDNWLIEKLADRFSRSENEAFVIGRSADFLSRPGRSIAAPRGFLTYPDQTPANVIDDYERGAIQQFPMTDWSLISDAATRGAAADSLVRLKYELRTDYHTNATYVMTRRTMAQVMTLRGDDNYFFGMTFLRDGTPTMSIQGTPVEAFEDMPEIATDALFIAIADWRRSYTVLDRVALQILRDPYTSKGNVLFYSTKRTGGDVTNFDAIKIGRSSAS